MADGFQSQPRGMPGGTANGDSLREGEGGDRRQPGRYMMADSWEVAAEIELVTDNEEGTGVTADTRGDGDQAAEQGGGGESAHRAARSRAVAPATGKSMPFQLRIEETGLLGQLADKYPELRHTMQQLAASMLAKGTISTYGAVVKAYIEFCKQHGYESGQPTEEHVLHFIATRTQEGMTFSTVEMIKPALTALWDLQGTGQAVFTARVERILEGAKRLAAKDRPPVKKAGEVTLLELKAIVEKYMPVGLENGQGDVYKMRTVTRIVVEYFTMCRGADYRQLQVKHLKKIGADIEIYFPSAKNDQHHQGNSTMLRANGSVLCPVRVLKMYLWRLGIQIGEPTQGNFYLHGRIRKVAGRWIPDPAVASMALATEGLREILGEMDMVGRGITDKSFKMLGVTATLEAGASTKDVALHGRWRTESMPLRYKHNSVAFKKSTADKVPF
jgi:hypothetical protein